MYSNRVKNPLNQINTLAARERDAQIEGRMQVRKRETERERWEEREVKRIGGQRAAAEQIMLKGIIVNIRGKCCNLNL